MKIINRPSPSQWESILRRPKIQHVDVEDTLKTVFETVRTEGDKALYTLTEKFENIQLSQLYFDTTSPPKIEDKDLLESLNIAYENITKFHQSQRVNFNKIETSHGVTCWQKNTPIQKIGLYIPGGSAPLFSTLLMLGIPAKLAGCEEIVVCTPSQKNGQPHPLIVHICHVLGLQKLWTLGGAQAIAAMSLGTESVPKVDKIFGPGNIFVTKAKQWAQQCGVAIDMPAGPSEVLIIADDTASPQFLAADLLSQAEHGADSQVVLISDDDTILHATVEEIQSQLKEIPRHKIAHQSLQNSLFIRVENISEAMEMSNHYAPEHLILAVKDPQFWGEKVKNAGSVFLGHYACESAGDYASGTNHTLPTHGFAKAYGGVSLDSFYKKISFQNISKQGIATLGPHIERLAMAENLWAHKNAVTVRLKKLKENGSR